QKAFEIQDSLADDFPEQTDYRVQAERYRFELGNLLEEAGQPSQARAAYTQALDYLETLAEGGKADAVLLNYIGLVADSLAELGGATEPEEARPLYERSLEASREAWRLSQQSPQYQYDLRSTYWVYGRFLGEQGLHAELAELADRFAADAPEPRID